MIFESIINSEWFVNTTIVLYFNKLELFHQKLAMGIPIKKYFPNYQGKNSDLQNAHNFFIGKFREIRKDPAKEVHILTGSATDADNARDLIAFLQKLITE